MPENRATHQSFDAIVSKPYGNAFCFQRIRSVDSNLSVKVYHPRGFFSIPQKPKSTVSCESVDFADYHFMLWFSDENGKGNKASAQSGCSNESDLNPCDYMQLPKKQSIDYVIPTPEQLDDLLQELSNHEAYYTILICAVLGCQRGEALGLQWRDIDFEQNTISIRRAYIYYSMTHRKIGELKTKNSRRTLSLPEALKAELLKLKTG